MSCPEYLRLREHYEAALLRWVQIDLSFSGSEFINVSAMLLEGVKQQALKERNAAKERMDLHEQNCLICNRRQKPHRIK